MGVLSVQSHVVYGYAGNTAAVFPLQRLGREVWAVNTVEFSNHTGYGSWRGKALGAGFVLELVLGLEERGVLKDCEAVLSGYLGDADVANAIVSAVKKARNASPGALYCCDPVMGDVGRGFYVKPDIPDMFKNTLVPLADIVCPNQFELEVLTGITIENVSLAIKAIETLHEKGPSIVLLTSFREKQGEIGMIASDKTNMYKITTPELPLKGSVAGTGDITTSIFLSRYLETYDLQQSLSLCTASVFGILEQSLKTQSPVPDSNFPFELKLIDAQNELIKPSHFFETEKIV